MKKQGVYAWVCFVFFIVLVVGLAGSARTMEIREYNRAVLSYYGSSGQEVIQIQRKLKIGGIITEQLTVSMVTKPTEPYAGSSLKMV